MVEEASPNPRSILIERLKEADLSLRRFLKVDEKKAAFEMEWQRNLYTPEELKEYPRWGIAGRDELVLTDTDNEKMTGIIREILPFTFETISPRRKLPHFYFKVVGGEVPNKILHLPNDPKGSGEIRSQNQYVVAPGTVITFKDLETGEKKKGRYEILHDRPIATVSFNDFMKAINPFLGAVTSQKITFEQMREGVPQGTRHSQGIKYATFLVKVQRFDFETALGEMKRWNKLCKPPMVEHDLERMVKNAISYPDKTVKQVEDQSEIEETVKEFKGKETYPIFYETLGFTVKRDNIAKQHDFLNVLSMYASPVNEVKEAPTSEGKTYPVMQIIRMFPKDDVMVLGGLSPTALAHDYGIPVNKEGEDLRPAIEEINDKIEKLKDEQVEAERTEKPRIKREIEKLQTKRYKLTKGSKRLIDLENKVLVFVDNPNPSTWARLRPIMSHDKWETTYKFTDRKGKSGPLTQVTAILRGWPVFIAFKAEETQKKGWGSQIWEQILTRGTTVPVEMSKKKYGEAIQLTGIRKGLPQVAIDRRLHLDDFLKCRRIIKAIKHQVLTLKEKARAQTGNCESPNIFWIPFYKVVAKNFPKTKGAHMREVDRFFSIIQNHAVANIFYRPTLKIGEVSSLICTLKDLEKAIELYFSEEARKTIFSKIPQHQVKFFDEVILPLSQTGSDKGISTVDMQKKYREVNNEGISINTINYHYLQPLESFDLISRDDDPSDKRRKLTVPLREEVFNVGTEICTRFEKGDIFSFEMLVEAFNSLRKLIVGQPPSNRVIIADHNGNTINIETLYTQYFAQKGPIRTGVAHYYFSEHRKQVEMKKEPENIPFLEKGVIHDLEKKKPPLLNINTEQNLIQLTPIHEAERCELCGEFPVKYEFVIDGQPIRRCQNCIDKMKDRGFKFAIKPQEEK